MGSDLLALKPKLIEHCFRFIDARIATLQTAISAAQESANDETKSSAGDKYETGRAMMQLEIEQNHQHLAEANKQRSILGQLNTTVSSPTIQPGSIAVTDQGNFFIAISVGQVELEGKLFLIVSAASPVGSALMGRQAGDRITFAKKSCTILSVA